MYKKIICMMFAATMLFFTSGCAQKQEKKKDFSTVTITSEQEKNAGIETVKAKREVLDLTISIPAQLKPIDKKVNKVYAPVDGKVSEVFVEQGQLVEKGQPLISIRSDYIGQIQSELLQSIIQIDADMKITRSQLNFAKNTFARETTLLKEKVTSRSEWENAKTEYDRQNATLNALSAKRSAVVSAYRERLALYGSDPSVTSRVASSGKIYPYIILKSDKNGIITERLANVEEFVPANKELLNVVDLSSVWLVGNLYEKDVNLVKVGDKMTADIEGLKPVEGTVIYAAPMMDEKTKTLTVRAELPNPNLELKPNMYAKMKINVGKLDTVAVPITAVQKYGDSNLVYIKTGEHTYEERKVETGEKTADYVEIKSGVKVGETVVTKGSFSLLGEFIKEAEEN